MELRDTAEILGNLGEFIGAIAVVVTLVYFAVQIRQNLKANRAQALSTWNTAAQAEKEVLYRDPNFARIYREAVIEEKSLLGDDEVQFYAYCIQMMNTWHLAFTLCKLDVMKREFLQGVSVGYTNYFASSRQVSEWWISRGAPMYSKEFVQFVNDHIRGR